MKLPIDGVPLLPPDVVAPEKQTLRYTSHAKLYAIGPEQTPLEGDLDGLYSRECHIPKPQQGLPQHIGEYTVTIEANIGSSKELNEASQRINVMAKELDKFWVYSCGEPLSPVLIQLSFDVTPKGWLSNTEDLKNYLLTNCRSVIAVVRANPRHWMVMPYYPLLPALRAREKYQTADPLTKALADLHYVALSSPLGEGRLFSFARALELARRILTGKDDATKEASLRLPGGSLKRSLHWLFDVANNRYNTRHVVNRRSAAPALHAPMSGQELIDYQHDADLILRTLVCQRLQIQTPNVLPAGA